MPVLTCFVDECPWQYSCDFDQEQSLSILKMHVSMCHETPSVKTGQNREPKIARPMVDVGINEEEWNTFVIRWKQFRIGSGIGEVSARSSCLIAQQKP